MKNNSCENKVALVTGGTSRLVSLEFRHRHRAIRWGAKAQTD